MNFVRFSDVTFIIITLDIIFLTYFNTMFKCQICQCPQNAYTVKELQELLNDVVTFTLQTLVIAPPKKFWQVHFVNGGGEFVAIMINYE